MAASSNNSGSDPDFSFLGDQSVPDFSDVPDFGDAPPDQPDFPDFPDFGDVRNVPDFSVTDDDGPPPMADEPPTPAVPIAVEKPAPRATKRLTPKAPPAATAPVETPQATEVKRKPPQPVISAAPTDNDDEEGTDAVDIAAVGKSSSGASSTAFALVAGYAAAVTLAVIGLLLTDRISLSGRNILESLPDVEPLRSNEFRKVPDDAELPAGHALNLGESRRYGDVVLTPFKITREQINFVNMMNGAAADGQTSKPVLKLWFRMTNASTEIAFPPWDVALMTHRSEKNESAVANSWLMVTESGTDTETQVLNYFHSPDSNLDMKDHHSRELLNPGTELTSYIASSESISQIAPEKIEGYRWRIQIRKGVHFESGHGVTTLVDVNFSPSDIES